MYIKDRLFSIQFGSIIIILFAVKPFLSIGIFILYCERHPTICFATACMEHSHVSNVWRHSTASTTGAHRRKVVDRVLRKFVELLHILLQWLFRCYKTSWGEYKLTTPNSHIDWQELLNIQTTSRLRWFPFLLHPNKLATILAHPFTYDHYHSKKHVFPTTKQVYSTFWWMLIERVVQMYRRNKFSQDWANKGSEWEIERSNSVTAKSKESGSWSFSSFLVVIVWRDSATYDLVR